MQPRLRAGRTAEHDVQLSVTFCIAPEPSGKTARWICTCPKTVPRGRARPFLSTVALSFLPERLELPRSRCFQCLYSVFGNGQQGILITLMASRSSACFMPVSVGSEWHLESREGGLVSPSLSPP